MDTVKIHIFIVDGGVNGLELPVVDSCDPVASLEFPVVLGNLCTVQMYGVYFTCTDISHSVPYHGGGRRK